MRGFILGALVLAFVVFAVYAVVTQYQTTAPGSVPARVAAAFSAAALALGAAVAQYFHGVVP